MIQSSRYIQQNNQIPGESDLSIYKIDSININLFIFRIKLKTGYFGFSRSTRTLYMFNDGKDNTAHIDIMDNTKLLTSHEATYTYKDSILLVTSSVNKTTPSVEFSLHFDKNASSEYRCIFQLCYCMI